jgi:hypothetical protein
MTRRIGLQPSKTTTVLSALASMLPHRFAKLFNTNGRMTHLTENIRFTGIMEPFYCGYQCFRGGFIKAGFFWLWYLHV